MHCQKAFFLKHVLRESSAIKYALTSAASICHCWKNGRYFYKTRLATLCERHAIHKFCCVLVSTFGVYDTWLKKYYNTNKEVNNGKCVKAAKGFGKFQATFQHHFGNFGFVKIDLGENTCCSYQRCNWRKRTCIFGLVTEKRRVWTFIFLRPRTYRDREQRTFCTPVSQAWLLSSLGPA